MCEAERVQVQEPVGFVLEFLFAGGGERLLSCGGNVVFSALFFPRLRWVVGLCFSTAV